MTVNLIRRNQIHDESIVEEDELNSSGLAGSPFKSSLTISSVTSSTKTIEFNSSVDLIADPRIQENDILKITSGDAVGEYAVDEIIDEITCTVKEAIPDASSGNGEFYYRNGAKITGFDPTDAGFPAEDLTVYDALKRVRQEGSNAISSGVFYWARPNASSDAYLYNYGSGPPASDKVGIPIFVTPAKLNALGIGNGTDNISFTVKIYAHSGGSLTLVHSQSVTLGVGEYYKIFTGLDKAISGGNSLACQLVYTSQNKPSGLQVSAGVIKAV